MIAAEKKDEQEKPESEKENQRPERADEGGPATAGGPPEIHRPPPHPQLLLLLLLSLSDETRIRSDPMGAWEGRRAGGFGFGSDLGLTVEWNGTAEQELSTREENEKENGIGSSLSFSSPSAVLPFFVSCLARVQVLNIEEGGLLTTP